MRPSFNPIEEYFIASYRLQHRKGGFSALPRDACYVLAGAVLLGIGFKNNDFTWAIIGFGLLAFRFVQGMISSAKYNPVIASIIDKYEVTLSQQNPEVTAGSNPLREVGPTSSNTQLLPADPPQ